jgi:hypothetical protein
MNYSTKQQCASCSQGMYTCLVRDHAHRQLGHFDLKFISRMRDLPLLIHDVCMVCACVRVCVAVSNVLSRE